MSLFHPDKKPEYEEVTEAIVKRYCLHCDSEIKIHIYWHTSIDPDYRCNCSAWEKKRGKLKWENWR